MPIKPSGTLDPTNAAHTEFNFVTTYICGGSIVHADQGLSVSHETVNAKNFWADCCRAPDDLEQDHFKAHIGKRVLDHIVWGNITPPKGGDDTWPDGQFIWKDHVKCLAKAGMVTSSYPTKIMMPGKRKSGNLRAKGAPGVIPAKHLMCIEKVTSSDKQKLLNGLLCTPESPSEGPRKVYYHPDGAALSTSSKVTAKKSSSSQPQKCSKIHIFSSKSCIAEDSNNKIIKLPSPDHDTKSRTKKRPLSDSEEVIEVKEAHSNDSDDKMAVTKAKKNATRKAEASGVRTVKKNGKKGAEAVRGRRGGRAGGRGGKAHVT
ncbi:hypothetical protein PILCRDRAFT_14022 [Piloderma croceum F 1598]|uniref:Uncharacterized protein n=1 Tax=Piloderma croceum (strain F 1598) TaxID=765440 RepID=A0A0C3AM29_PILCF|nr:hypothetical protein PILCRDRAFT_14022 [Piloderma croceum F 1598]